MKQQEILAKVKANLRISHTKLDGELSDTIAACLADLQICGVRAPQVDVLTLNAIKLFCRAAFTDDTTKAAAYMARYESLKASMMLSSDYRVGDCDE